MHDLAPPKLASPLAVGWNSARIPGRMLEGFDAIHLKALPAREGDLAASYGLPGPLATASIGNVEALQVSPGEWLLVASLAHLRDLDEIERRTNEKGFASVRCGSRFCILELDAPTDVFAGLTGLPSEALEPGRVARIRLADIPIVLSADTDGRLRLIFDRTHALHLRAWLDRAT